MKYYNIGSEQQKFGRADALQSRDTVAQSSHKMKKLKNIKQYLTSHRLVT